MSKEHTEKIKAAEDEEIAEINHMIWMNEQRREQERTSVVNSARTSKRQSPILSEELQGELVRERGYEAAVHDLLHALLGREFVDGGDEDATAPLPFLDAVAINGLVVAAFFECRVTPLTDGLMVLQRVHGRHSPLWQPF